jgi:hypothetical protein
MNELIFGVYRVRQDRTEVTVQNAATGDKPFLDAVAKLIRIWMSDKEAGR